MFPQMNFSQLQEQLRLELLRRIERGVLTGTLLARQTGFRQSHISNFLHRKRLLSQHALDRVLSAQMLSVSDLVPASAPRRSHPAALEELAYDTVPLVSQSAVIHEPHIRPQAILDEVRIPGGILDHLRPRRAIARRDWQRFVAIRITPHQAAAMEPLLRPHAILIIDRHYNSLAPYQPGQHNLYAIRADNTLHLRFASFESDRLILRPYRFEYPIELLELPGDEMPSDRLMGRACLSVAEL
jgi:hypothetical protein